MKIIERITRGSLAYVEGDGNEVYSWIDTDEPIVRCRDCKLTFEQGKHKCCGVNHNENGEAYLIDPDGFCKWGERKD